MRPRGVLLMILRCWAMKGHGRAVPALAQGLFNEQQRVDDCCQGAEPEFHQGWRKGVEKTAELLHGPVPEA
eukprot:7720201-Alexandrium_andersonii.AAC.1